MNIVPLLTNLLLIVFLWGLNLAQGMSLTLTQILAPFKRWGTILLAVALNSVVIPLLYWGVTYVVPMTPGRAIGLMLVGFAAAAPIGVKAAVMEHGDVPLAIGLVVLLGALNIIAVPLWASLLLPAGTIVDPVQILVTLVELVLLPLTLGLIVKARWATWADRLVPIAKWVTNIALIGFVLLTVIANLQAVLSLFSSLAILAAVIAIVLSAVLGYLIGYDTPSRRTVSSVTAIRAAGPALAVASTTFAGNKDVIVTAAALAVILVLLALVVPAAWGRMSVAGAHPKDVVPA